MNISTGNKFSFLGFIALLSLWGFVVLQLMDIQQEQSTKNGDYHLRSYNIAHELRQNSDDLTRMARTYVSTGNTIYKQYYFEILAIRNGEAPRPRKYPSTYWYTALDTDRTSLSNLGKQIPIQTLMREVGFKKRSLFFFMNHRIVQTNLYVWKNRLLPPWKACSMMEMAI